MTRKTRFVIGTIFTLGLLAGVSYQALRPKWVLATSAEIDKVIDPILLKKDPPNPEAEERYERFEALLQKLKPSRFQSSYTTASSATISSESAKFRAENHGVLESFGPLFHEGPFMQAHRNALEFQVPAKKKALAKGLALIIRDRSLPIEDRIHALVLGEELSIRCFEDSRTIIDFLVSVAICVTVAQSAADFFTRERLSTPQAKLALDHVSDLESLTKLQPIIVGDFRVEYYSFLPDPLAYIRKNAAALKSSLSDEEINEDPPGNYDAIATARMFSDLSVEQISICELPPAKMSTPKADAVDKIRRSLPSDESDDEKGLEQWWKKRVYRFRMQQIPNSFSYYFAPTSFVREISRARFGARAWNQLLRAQLACAIYENDKGHLPASLSDLAKAHILQPVPLDPFDGAPLRYDPKRKIIWSIGRDEKNDHGSENRSSNLPEDMVVHLN